MSESKYPIPLENQVSDDLFELLNRLESANSIIASANTSLPAGNVRAFSAQVAEAINIEPDDVFPVLYAFSNLKKMRDVFGEPTEHFLDRLTVAIERFGPPWTESSVARWKDARTDLVQALNSITADGGLMISAKTASLAYDRPCVLHHARILSDVRPVFGEDARTIHEMVVTHTLKVEFTDGRGYSEMHFALDASDVAKLRQECERADIKAQSIVDALKDKRWETIIFPAQNG